MGWMARCFAIIAFSRGRDFLRMSNFVRDSPEHRCLFITVIGHSQDPPFPDYAVSFSGDIRPKNGEHSAELRGYPTPLIQIFLLASHAFIILKLLGGPLITHTYPFNDTGRIGWATGVDFGGGTGFAGDGEVHGSGRQQVVTVHSVHTRGGPGDISVLPDVVEARAPSGELQRGEDDNLVAGKVGGNLGHPETEWARVKPSIEPGNRSRVSLDGAVGVAEGHHGLRAYHPGSVHIEGPRHPVVGGDGAVPEGDIRRVILPVVVPVQDGAEDGENGAGSVNGVVREHEIQTTFAVT
nr:hypothetical protein DM860_009049 [Ipomoea batatas]